MRKIILLLIIILISALGTYLFYNYKINNTKEEYHKFLYVKDLNPKSFIELFVKEYNKTPLNSVTLSGDFPDNWVQQKDLDYLISIIDSKQKCCNYMNVFSSTISNEDAEVGGFAIIFLDSYINKTKINLGLNCSPKTDTESVKRIKNWYKTLEN